MLMYVLEDQSRGNTGTTINMVHPVKRCFPIFYLLSRWCGVRRLAAVPLDDENASHQHYRVHIGLCCVLWAHGKFSVSRSAVDLTDLTRQGVRLF